MAVIPNFLPKDLVTAMRADARNLFEAGTFQPDGLTNTALSKKEQGFSQIADRQTFRGGADWVSDLGDSGTRLEFRDRMNKIKDQLALELNRPSLKIDGEKRNEMTYNWYEPGAKLGRHLDEHHEETKGIKVSLNRPYNLGQQKKYLITAGLVVLDKMKVINGNHLIINI